MVFRYNNSWKHFVGKILQLAKHVFIAKASSEIRCGAVNFKYLMQKVNFCQSLLLLKTVWFVKFELCSEDCPVRLHRNYKSLMKMGSYRALGCQRGAIIV
jgi:hypothetical protein